MHNNLDSLKICLIPLCLLLHTNSLWVTFSALLVCEFCSNLFLPQARNSNYALCTAGKTLSPLSGCFWVCKGVYDSHFKLKVHCNFSLLPCHGWLIHGMVRGKDYKRKIILNVNKQDSCSTYKGWSVGWGLEAEGSKSLRSTVSTHLKFPS